MIPKPDKHARVYFRREGKQVLVVTIHRSINGGYFEAEGGLSLTTWDDDALGESIQTSLDQSGEISRENDARPKIPDPATLRISGEPSLRAFDASFILVEIVGSREPGAWCVIQADCDKATRTAIKTILPGDASASEFARQATRIFQICRDRKF